MSGAIAVVSHGLLMLSGYDRTVVVRLNPAEVAALTMSSMLCFISAGMYAAAASYLAYIAVYADGARWPISIGIGAGVLIFAITMQRLYVTTGGYAHHWDQERLAQWRPDKLRLVCVLIIASLLSLPFVLMRNHTRLDQQIEEQRATKVALYRHQLHKARQLGQQEIIRARALAAEREQQIAALATGRTLTLLAGANMAPAHRKALLIGAQRYQHARVANGVSTDVELLQRALSSAGFTTMMSFDDSGDKLRLRIDAYLKSLVPGDISVVYYGGRASQRAGRNFLLPVDYHPERNANHYPVAQLVDDLVKTAPQLNAVILDTAFWQDSDAQQMLAPVRRAPRSVFLVSAGAGAGHTARLRDGGPLAIALAHQITSSADIRQALGRAAEEASRPSSSADAAKQVTLVYGQSSGPGEPGAPTTQLAETTACPSETGFALERCLHAYMRMFDDRLEALKQGRVEDDFALRQYQQSLARSSMLRERWKLLWKDPSVFLQVVVVVLTMMLGDLLRDLRAGPLRHYEQLRASNARGAVELAYAGVRKTVGDMLASCPTGPFPGLRWHERNCYFGPPSGAWLSLGGIVAPPTASNAEFRQALGLSGQAAATLAATTQFTTIPDPELPV